MPYTVQITFVQLNFPSPPPPPVHHCIAPRDGGTRILGCLPVARIWPLSTPSVIPITSKAPPADGAGLLPRLGRQCQGKEMYRGAVLENPTASADTLLQDSCRSLRQGLKIPKMTAGPRAGRKFADSVCLFLDEMMPWANIKTSDRFKGNGLSVFVCAEP